MFFFLRFRIIMKFLLINFRGFRRPGLSLKRENPTAARNVEEKKTISLFKRSR